MRIETLSSEGGTEPEASGEQRAVARVAAGPSAPRGLVINSSAMREVVDVTRRLAKVDSTVLITGESGCGKEVIARLIHDESARVNGPFIAVNCGAITEALLESELFGHARGAFTGASHHRPGLFEAARGGTLLLDEIGEIPEAMQVKLLRVLQERTVRRVGENTSRPIDVRVLAATNSDLTQRVAAGEFRLDLYYRVKVVELRVPALRDRGNDILELAQLLLDEASQRMGRPMLGLTPEAADRVLRHAWPGNVRELGNAMECAVALAQGNRVTLSDLPEELRLSRSAPAKIQGAVRLLQDVVREYILAALALNGGNQAHTAEQLGIGSATLYRKLKLYKQTSSGGSVLERAPTTASPTKGSGGRAPLRAYIGPTFPVMVEPT